MDHPLWEELEKAQEEIRLLKVELEAERKERAFFEKAGRETASDLEGARRILSQVVTILTLGPGEELKTPIMHVATMGCLKVVQDRWAAEEHARGVFPVATPQPSNGMEAWWVQEHPGGPQWPVLLVPPPHAPAEVMIHGPLPDLPMAWETFNGLHPQAVWRRLPWPR